jgi:hypothetical protein
VGRDCGCVKNPIKRGDITNLFVELSVIVFSLRRRLDIRWVVLDALSCRHCRLLRTKGFSARVSKAGEQYEGIIEIISEYVRYSLDLFFYNG